MSSEIAYSIIRRAVADNVFLQTITNNPDDVIKKEGITDSKAIAELRQLLFVLLDSKQRNTTLYMFIANQLKSTSEIADAFKAGLKRTIDQIDIGFRSTMTMYMVAFYMGIGLIVTSIALAVVMDKTLLPIIFGVFGVIDVVGFFVKKPSQRLQGSRADLAQLQAVYFNWFVDVYNWNGYISILGQTKGLDYEKVKQISTTLLENTDKTMSLVEKYCEFEGKPSVSSQE
ncbi:MAG: hypothetical protein CV087_07085 [Candidatus Brocadia sp. WS118]|nr:MAG: hypothetical protein CV087_07085 [Candidatus Brocadia sp. WS118]